MSLDMARRVADTVLYEGYVLYPYRASAQKNQLRWQWGVLAPPAWGRAHDERSANQTEVLLDGGAGATIQLVVRFLQAQAKQVEAADGAAFRPVERLEVGDVTLVGFDEGVEHEVRAEVSVADLLAGEHVAPIAVPAGSDVESVTGGRIVRERWAMTGVLRLSAEEVPGPYGLVRVRVRTENHTACDTEASRDEALRRSLIAAHSLLAVDAGTFLSLVDHPEWATGAVEACEQVGLWPVLVGEPAGRAMLASPIILGDHPEIAPESPADLCDATEIDEILTLRTLTLTDAEKAEARGTDARAAAIVDGADALPPELLERLHGAIRSVKPVVGGTAGASVVDPPEESVPWWDPGADASVNPETDTVLVGGVAVGKGDQVRLALGSRRTDAQDMFLSGRLAVVEAVMTDVEDERYLAVTLADDEAADLARWHGRYRYFYPDEVALPDEAAT